MHWKAIYFDRKNAEVCYFDSLVSELTEAVLRGIKQIMRKMTDPLYFKLKINRIKFQADDPSTCGPFALKFIADMYAGKQFKVATRFTDEHVSGEKIIIKYIRRWGYVENIMRQNESSFRLSPIHQTRQAYPFTLYRTRLV
jgi:hypothetical protein